MLKALFWKDVRMNRLPLVAAWALLLVPYFIPGAMLVMNAPIWEDGPAESAWAALLGTGSFFSLMCSQASIAMLGGNLIAVERGDRSAEFLAYLPPSRGQILLSKASLLIGAQIVIIGLNGLVVMIALWLAGNSETPFIFTGDFVDRSRLVMVGVAAAGCGWLASSMLQSSGPPVALAFLSPMIIFGCLNLVKYLSGWPAYDSFPDVYFATCGMVGPATFVAGCLYYLRRVEP